MTHIFTADMMDQSPSLHSSRFIQELTTHASTLAVSPFRPNGLNDLHVCVPSLVYILIHPDHENGFCVPPLDPLPADASPVDRYNHTTQSAYLLVIIQAVQTLKTFALSIVGSDILATLKHPTYGFTRLGRHHRHCNAKLWCLVSIQSRLSRCSPNYLHAFFKPSSKLNHF